MFKKTRLLNETVFKPLTGYVVAAGLTAALSAGASEYLTKPFVPGALLSTVRELLDARVSRGR